VRRKIIESLSVIDETRTAPDGLVSGRCQLDLPSAGPRYRPQTMTNRDPHSWMWADALDLLEQADRLHRQFFALKGSAGAQVRWEPPIDVVESTNELRVTVALPGVPAERIEVHLDNDLLAICGVRPPPACSHTAVIRRIEIPYGRFERRIALPAGRYELAEQSCAHGCLYLKLRRS
jgi:HSP20 family molecular chaperone IbpA